MKTILEKALILALFFISSVALGSPERSKDNIYSEKIDMAMQLIFEEKNRGERREIFDQVHEDVIKSARFEYGSTEYWKVFLKFMIELRKRTNYTKGQYKFIGTLYGAMSSFYQNNQAKEKQDVK